jgi:uncharacterized protein (DUF302 family)
MTWFFTKTLHSGFDEAVAAAIDGLKAQGFGVLTDIDVRKTIKEKLGPDFPNYRILGACNPPLAHRALELEGRIGLMLPCNVIVREVPPGDVEIAAIDPVAAMEPVSNPELTPVAEEARDKLKRVIDGLAGSILLRGE